MNTSLNKWRCLWISIDFVFGRRGKPTGGGREGVRAGRGTILLHSNDHQLDGPCTGRVTIAQMGSRGLGGLGVCGDHKKWLQLRACKIWCEAVRETLKLFRDQQVFDFCYFQGARRREPPRRGHNQLGCVPLNNIIITIKRRVQLRFFECPFFEKKRNI